MGRHEKVVQNHFMVTVRVDIYYTLCKWLTLRFQSCFFRFVDHRA